MKFFYPAIILAFAALLSIGCVSRTTTSEKGFGEDRTEKKLIWIWEKEFRKPK
jgi:hypothetical protein